MDIKQAKEGFTIKKIVIFVLIICLGFVLKFCINNYKEINHVLEGERFDFKHFYSPDKGKQITLMLHTDGVFHYESYIYVINGRYKKEKPPDRKEYIKFPNGTGVYIKWIDNKNCNIISSNQPKINNLSPENYNINLTVSREEIDAFFERGEGDKVIRYQIKD